MAHDKRFACILFHIKSVDKMETLLIIGGKSVNYVLYRRKNNRRTMTILLRSQPNEEPSCFTPKKQKNHFDWSAL